MTTRNQPIYQQLVDSVIEREKSRGITTLPAARDTAIKACLASTEFALYYAARGCSKFGLDLCLSHDGEHVSGLPSVEESRRGLELCAVVLADIRARERGGGSPDGGSPTFAGDVDSYLQDLRHMVPGRGDFRNPDPGGGAGAARPAPYEYQKAA